jgi:Cu+-exporting ATPase
MTADLETGDVLGAETQVQTMVFSVGGMHCASCGLLIDDVVEDLPGVTRSATDVNAGRTVVTTKEGAAPETGVVVDAITELGYSARLNA